MNSPINRARRDRHHFAIRQTTPLCAVAAIASFAAGLPAGVPLVLGGLAIVSYVLRPATTVQI